MNRKLWLWLLAALAAVCAALAVFLPQMSIFEAVLCFPFAPLGRALRALSLSGTVGNATAIVLYVLLSLVPAGYCFARWRKAQTAWEDLLLLSISGSLFFTLYGMINASALPFPLASVPFRRAMLGGLIWVQVAAYVVLRLLRSAFCADKAKLRVFARVGLVLLSALLTYDVFGSGVQALLENLRTLRENNTDGGSLLLTQLVLILRAVTYAVPQLMEIWVCFAAQRLLKARAQAQAVQADAAAALLAARCRVTLSVSVLLGAAVYVVQLLLSRSIRSLALEVNFPLGALGFCLAALLLARLLQENRQLREDNDLFI